jgi:hypothetical protein
MFGIAWVVGEFEFPAAFASSTQLLLPEFILHNANLTSQIVPSVKQRTSSPLAESMIPRRLNHLVPRSHKSSSIFKILTPPCEIVIIHICFRRIIQHICISLALEELLGKVWGRNEYTPVP